MISLATQQNINDEFEEINRFATLYLELPEGLKQQTQIRANLFGATKSISGEIVFQTGMCGYIEVLFNLLINRDD